MTEIVHAYAYAGAVLDGVDPRDIVIGTEGADSLVGSEGRDFLVGLGGNDRLEGKGGSDILDGGLGVDTLIGGPGDDKHVVDNAGDVVTEEANGGVDGVWTSLASYALGANVEKLVYVGAADFSGAGNAADNVLIGGVGADTLDGGAGHDRLYGNVGSDLLIGGAGDDVLTGGPWGQDTFKFSAGFGHDVITDFRVNTLSHDVIHFDGVFADLADALDSAAQVGSDVVFTDDAANTLTVKNVTVAQLADHPNDFLFT